MHQENANTTALAAIGPRRPQTVVCTDFSSGCRLLHSVS